MAVGVVRTLSDRYVLGDVIGAGGAAVVHRARDRHLGRDVAVKVLDDTAARCADPAARDRFLAEARSAARFDHPHLVTVYDAGEDDGTLFLVMELVEGHTLAELIACRGPFPVDQAVAIARQVLLGVGTAHERGIVHRDVKPANVLVDRSGLVRLADFGIAKHLDEIEDALTSDGMVMGTPSYLAPEQAAGHALSPATDIHAVGLLLHEMLTGQPRSGGRTSAAASVSAPLDPRAHRPDVPARIADVVVRATDPDPAGRYPSAAAMIAALDGAATTHSSPAGMPTTSAATSAIPAAIPTGTAGRPSAKTAVMPAVTHSPASTTAFPGSGDGPSANVRSPRWWAAILVSCVLLIAGLAVAADRSGSDRTDDPTTTVAPAGGQPGATLPPVDTVAEPAAVAPPAEDPPSGPGDDGAARGKQKGKDKKNKND